MGIDADTGSKDDAIANAEEGAVEDRDAAGPKGAGAYLCAPKAEPERIEAGDKAEDFFEEGEAVEDHLELEGDPPRKEGGRAEGGVVTGAAASGEERAGEERREEVEENLN